MSVLSFVKLTFLKPDLHQGNIVLAQIPAKAQLLKF